MMRIVMQIWYYYAITKSLPFNGIPLCDTVKTERRKDVAKRFKAWFQNLYLKTWCSFIDQLVFKCNTWFQA